MTNLPPPSILISWNDHHAEHDVEMLDDTEIVEFENASEGSIAK